MLFELEWERVSIIIQSSIPRALRLNRLPHCQHPASLSTAVSTSQTPLPFSLRLPPSPHPAQLSLAASLLPPQEFFFMSDFVQQMFLNGACQLAVTVPTCVMATESMFGVSMHITTLQYK